MQDFSLQTYETLHDLLKQMLEFDCYENTKYKFEITYRNRYIAKGWLNANPKAFSLIQESFKKKHFQLKIKQQENLPEHLATSIH